MFICPGCLKFLRITTRTKAVLYTTAFNHQKRTIINISRQTKRSFSSSSTVCAKPGDEIDLTKFSPENIRNFSIIAHVDHGKSTLADRLLEITGTIPKNAKNQQVLDTLQVEKERGITVKARTASLFHTHKGQTYLLNLIDTPGHVDFSYEVSRSLSACQGVILLVDANQGVQAQTMANFFLAFERNLTIIPCLNKIDLHNAKPEIVLEQLNNVFDTDPDDVFKISAKVGTGVQELLAAIIEKIPPPPGDRNKPLKCLVFDSQYDQYRGAVGNILVLDGSVKKGDKIMSLFSKKSYEVQGTGILHPNEKLVNVLYAGQVGFIHANFKKISDFQVGDTFCHQKSPVEPLPGFKPAVSVVFAGIFPSDQSQLIVLKAAMTKLTLNDGSVSVNVESSPAIGQGWRLGFLGMLHMDVFCQRLEQEFGTSVIITAPNVHYRVRIKGKRNIKLYGDEIVDILNPCKLPDLNIIEELLEPMIMATIIIPDQYLTAVMSLCHERRGNPLEQTYLDQHRMVLKCIFPLNEVLIDFFDELKSITSGYASFDYEDHGYQQSDLVKVEFLINKNPVEEMTLICHRSNSRNRGKEICVRLKELIPRQMTYVTIQAIIGSDIVAREDIKPIKKDVLAKCYGGDVTRKNKLLNKQAAHLKKLKMVGTVKIPKDTFIKVLKKK
ncbi:translation factor Guf1, mitochondrial-like isoform X2 [Mizuhopecten yessoensis]|uniref:translation factor Guf1, mitochondrial-like isoform X1 n=1 Tax=Mizuhopecten yessoensis TaxID=6573 RepID=UPI000B45873E|nr:translation factor Guf1, mitochondrial-like isoform X1 [Mizuhopecten yessoensis]XP_021359157.1 translation factor Guf1, mitochondrial-like isoform X2 [Mizuhopecten yessoensis]